MYIEQLSSHFLVHPYLEHRTALRRASRPKLACVVAPPSSAFIRKILLRTA